MTENKMDARKLDHKTLEAMRVRAVRQVQAGESLELVASGASGFLLERWGDRGPRFRVPEAEGRG